MKFVGFFVLLSIIGAAFAGAIPGHTIGGSHTGGNRISDPVTTIKSVFGASKSNKSLINGGERIETVTTN